MRVVGLDPSLESFGAAKCSGPGEPVVHRYQCGKARGHERLEEIRCWLHRVAEGADLAVVEGLVVSKFPATMLALAGLGTLVRHELWRMGIPYADVPPTCLKQYATRNGQADKIAVFAAAMTAWPELHLDSTDTADAAWLCAMGKHWAGEPIQRVNITQAEVLIAQWPATSGPKAKRGQPKIAWPDLAAYALRRDARQGVLPLAGSQPA